MNIRIKRNWPGFSRAVLFGLLSLYLPTVSLSAPTPAPPRVTPDFLVHDGDVWVMVGDSITWQNLYTVYLEAFIRARYPKLKFTTVNSGKSGEVLIGAMIRFRETIAAFKPSLVTVNYGMNDHTKVFPGDQNFLDKTNSPPQRFINAVQATGARLVICSASPIIAPADYSTDGGRYQLALSNIAPSGWRSNPVNQLFAEKLRQLADRNQIPFADQMTPLQTIWGANYSRDRVAAMRYALKGLTNSTAVGTNHIDIGASLLATLKPFLSDPVLVEQMPLPDKENLMRQWKMLKGAKPAQTEEFLQYLRGWTAQVDAATPPFVQVSGYTRSERAADLIHPNEAGHLCMAAALLKEFNADGLVSEVILDVKNLTAISATKATVRDLFVKDGIVSFKRLDESLPFPVDPLARPALDLDLPSPAGSMKDLFGLSRYLTRVKNLPAGSYEVVIDGTPVATVTAEQLASGFDSGLLDNGPIAEQSWRLLEAVRTQSKTVFSLKGARMPVTVGEPKIFTEAQPIEHVWIFRPVKTN